MFCTHKLGRFGAICGSGGNNCISLVNMLQNSEAWKSRIKSPSSTRNCPYCTHLGHKHTHTLRSFVHPCCIKFRFSTKRTHSEVRILLTVTPLPNSISHSTPRTDMSRVSQSTNYIAIITTPVSLV